MCRIPATAGRATGHNCWPKTSKPSLRPNRIHNLHPELSSVQVVAVCILQRNTQLLGKFPEDGLHRLYLRTVLLNLNSATFTLAYEVLAMNDFVR